MIPRVERDLPSGIVTFLFSDVEGSTRLLHELGTEQYMRVITDHRRVMRDAFEPRGGVEVGTEGDSFFVAFPSASEAVGASRQMSAALADGPIRVRIGLHTGQAHPTDEGYFGIDVHLAARIAAAGHGGQVLVSGATAELVGTDGLRDLGEHRLKDFDAPVTIFQLGDERFPPLKTISNTNLPRPASSFLGREREVAEIAELLQGGARLVTLTGPGGTGKTRLAIEAATTVIGQFKAGVFWIDLSPLRDPALVMETLGQVIGAQDDLAQHIGEREMLLVVDNLEQVIEAAPELANLLLACPRLSMLITSRERLRVRGEVEYPVAPLADADAVELFCARAGVKADEAVHQLCVALENLPLALELAAARASVLTPAQILERLSDRLDVLKGGRDADPRQKTLRATIEWSHDLLSPADRQLFARLAVFRGGWTLEPAEEVADADLDGLESLVDKSLVRHAGDRFWMLETIREFAAERLEASDEADTVRRRQADYFLALAESTEPRLRAEELGGGGREWVDRQALELDNSRAALDFFERAGDPQVTLRMVGTLTAVWANPLWATQSVVAEGRRRLERALALDRSPTRARAKALAAAAEMAHFSEETAAAREWAEEALTIFRDLDDPDGIADATGMLGVALGEGGDWVAARPLLEESLERYRELGNTARVMWGTRTLAWATAELGDLEAARPYYEDALRQARAAGNRLFESVVLGSLSWLAMAQGRLQDSPALMRESLAIQVEVGDPVEAGIGLGHAAQILAAVGRAESAAKLLAAFKTLEEEVGGAYPWVTQMNGRTLAEVREQLEPEVFEAAWEKGAKLTREEAESLALNELQEADRPG